MDQFYKDYSKHSKHCIYCGDPATSKDHVLALSKFTLDYPEGLYIVPCCIQCNNLAGGRLFKNVTEKQAFIREAIRKRFQWIMTEQSRRREQYLSLLIKAQKRLAWPDVISVESTFPKPVLGKGFARQRVATLSMRYERERRGERYILDAGFDDE